MTLVCGRYEGDRRARRARSSTSSCSIGDFVLAGGELAAAVVIEATARLVPGVLGCGLSAGDESFSAGRLEYPQWTRPADWNGQAVRRRSCCPGDHGAIARWRRRASLRLTQARRPDLHRRPPPHATRSGDCWQRSGADADAGRTRALDSRPRAV